MSLQASGKLYFQRLLIFPNHSWYSFGTRRFGIWIPQKAFLCRSSNARSSHSLSCFSWNFLSSRSRYDFLTRSSPNRMSDFISMRDPFELSICVLLQGPRSTRCVLPRRLLFFLIQEGSR